MSRILPWSAFCVLLLAAAGASYVDGPPPGHTGGFGEPTCHACHFDQEFNPPEAWAEVGGLPETFEADSAYALTIVVAREHLGAGGFSMSSRFADGHQAGELLASFDGRTQVVNGDSVQYAMHTLDGTEPVGADSTFWTLTWIAPASEEIVLFHLAANAANGDDSELGDFIRTDSARTHPAN